MSAANVSTVLFLDGIIAERILALGRLTEDVSSRRSAVHTEPVSVYSRKSLLPDAQAGTKDQVRRRALNQVNLVMMIDSGIKE